MFKVRNFVRVNEEERRLESREAKRTYGASEGARYPCARASDKQPHLSRADLSADLPPFLRFLFLELLYSVDHLVGRDVSRPENRQPRETPRALPPFSVLVATQFQLNFPFVNVEACDSTALCTQQFLLRQLNPRLASFVTAIPGDTATQHGQMDRSENTACTIPFLFLAAPQTFLRNVSQRSPTPS